MSDIKLVDLGSLAEIVMGTSPPGSSYNHENIGDPLLNGPTEFGPRHPHPELYTTEARRFARSGDLLFCVRGSTTGRMNWADRRYAVGRGIAAIRGSSTNETAFIQAAIELALPGVLAGATGSTMPNLNADAMFRIPVPLNPARERVGAFFGDIDDLIETNRRRIEVLEEMARAIYREWFVHFRYPGHEDSTLVDSSLGHIPEGWEVRACGDELTVLGGGTPSKKEPEYWDDGTVPWFTPSDLTKRRSRFATDPELRITEEGLARSSAKQFPAGSVMMTSRATLGVLAVATADSTTNQGFIVIHPDDRWSSGFIFEWLSAKAEELASIATGATFKEITKGAFKLFPFLVPDESVLAAHILATAPIEDQIRTLEQQSRNLVATRDLILPRVVTGQIDLSSLDLDSLVGEAVG